MSTPLDITARSTHDLWVDARRFKIDISRPTATTIKLDITRPVELDVTDGAIVLLSDKPINANSYPADGTQYAASSTPSWIAPQSLSGNAQVVGSFYEVLNLPFPTSVVTGSGSGAVETFSITVTDTLPNTIYYASVHAASNILQYYPIGVQSYPLSDDSANNSANTYAGSIPTYPSAPTAPFAGQVYHDQQLNIIQYFDGVSSSWIPTRADTIPTGAYNPGILGQVYLLGGAQLHVFNGTKWIQAKPDNLQLRVGAGWVPFTKLTSQTTEPATPSVGDVFYNYTIERIQYWDGSTWIFPNATNTLFNAGTTLVPNWVQAFVRPITVEPEKLNDPAIGQLFYNMSTHELVAWNGGSWNKVNTDQEGTAITDKVFIGSDGSYEARINLIKILNAQLGWPQLCVELKEEQFNIAIENAIQNYRQLSDGAYRRGFVIYKLIPGQQNYFLNSAIDKTDHIVDIHKIHRMGSLGVYGGGPNDVWAQAFAQQYYNLAAGGGDILSTHLVAAYGEELTRLFAGDLMFQWHEASRELFITRAIRTNETVIIEAMLERPEQELLQDRWCSQYLQNWALAELKMMLGLIRSKFASGTPGAGGTINLNGELLISEARQDMTELKESLLNFEFGGHAGLGNVSFCIG